MSYEAKHYGKQCTAKQVHSNKENSDVLLKQEMRLYKLHELNHPHIVQLLHLLDMPESPVLLMERMWMSLTDFLANKQSHHDKVSILRDVACGLQYIHEKDIIHGDLTAESILLNESFKAKLGDFGKATLVQQSIVRYLPETLDHIPPEVFEPYSNARYSTKVDVFSFGCVIIHTFTQEHPEPDIHKYVKISGVEKYKKHSEIERRSVCLNNFKSKVNSIKLLQIVSSCLQDDPDHRPTATSLLSLFEEQLTVYIASSFKYGMYICMHVKCWLVLAVIM